MIVLTGFRIITAQPLITANPENTTFVPGYGIDKRISATGIHRM